MFPDTIYVTARNLFLQSGWILDYVLHFTRTMFIALKNIEIYLLKMSNYIAGLELCRRCGIFFSKVGYGTGAEQFLK